MTCNRKYIQENKDGSYRLLDINSQEVRTALKTQEKRDSMQRLITLMQEEIKCIMEKCTHPVCYDEAGMPYDVRRCVTCGHTSLI